MEKTTILGLILRVGSNCKYWENNPQVYLIIMRE